VGTRCSVLGSLGGHCRKKQNKLGGAKKGQAHRPPKKKKTKLGGGKGVPIVSRSSYFSHGGGTFLGFPFLCWGKKKKTRGGGGGGGGKTLIKGRGIWQRGFFGGAGEKGRSTRGVFPFSSGAKPGGF